MEKGVGTAQSPGPPPEPRTVDYCDGCGGDIYEYESFGARGDERVHADCAREILARLTDGEILELCGFRVVRKGGGLL